MNFKHWILLGLVVVSTLIIGQAVTAPGLITIAQEPLFARAALPPLNMLVMGKDHKIYYEAYNDASDLDGDGVPDVGYQGWQTKVVDGVTKYKIDYFGYFNSYACYTWDGAKFNPVSAAPNKTCTGQWSGDFLNYLTTSRMDALRRVLYGGWRQVDDAAATVLQGAFFPQDAHSWGKEYQSVARDGYNISNYAPLSIPTTGNYHLFAVTTVTDNSAPLFRVMQNSPYRIWNWLSIEGPVAGNKCFTSGNSRVDCLSGSTTWALVPAGTLTGLSISTWKRTSGAANPGDRATMNTRFTNNAVAANLCGTGTVSNIDKIADGNPFNGSGCTSDNYMTLITGTLNIATAGTYRFAVDGDDAVDLTIDGVAVAGWYGGHANDRSDAGLNSHSGSIALTAGTHTITFRHEEGGGGDNWGLFWENPAGANRRDDYAVRVSVCPDDTTLQDSTCKAYPNGHYKPTGILHDYGESERMYFGLITGSQQNNLEGGKLRRNVGNFAGEITANTGQFRTDVNGIARSIDRLRMIGGAYNSGTNNLTGDSNWNWGNSTGDCAGTGNAISNGNCRMWGNPIAEMMYESLRYFAGAATATSRFATGGSTNGASEETTMGLATDTWKDPYKATANGGLGYPTCARPYQTIISDINPSYDGDLPGSAFTGAVTTVNDTPTEIGGFDAASQGQAIWNHEFGGARNVFIGETPTLNDGAPTAKSASSFGNIRGLAPEEPTKGGTYYSASVARFGRITDINAAASPQNLSTYSIALASPLPRIEVPVGTAGQKITLVPFAKTVSGTFGGGTRKPTNTIVDFYIQEMKNFPGQTVDATINGGLPKAVFRINYEDVEQGNDHDMDTIARYEVTGTSTGVNVRVISEYAAGSANQYMGYVLSGSSNDGIYLEICDLKNNTGNPGNSTDKNLCASNNTVYRFNTPPGRNPGYCDSGAPPADCAGLPPTSNVRSFVPGASSATQLMDPLWYAAKYGGFNDANGNNLPDTTEWDADADGVPDNYFLVTNPLNLRSQLTKAFDAIQQQNGTSGTISVAGARVDSTSIAMVPSYNSYAGGHDWTGELSAYNIAANGVLATVKWNASTGLATKTPGSRNILTAISNVTATNRATAVQDFQAANLGATPADQFLKLGYTQAQVTNAFGAITPAQMVAYLRGDRSKEGTVKPTAPFRKRSGVLGDIINSAPVIATNRANYGWGAATGLSAAQRTAYGTYVAGKSSRTEHVFVGANDGMLHAFDNAGAESFAYVPNGVLNKMAYLADPVYTHNYYVDGNLTLSDVLVGSNWQTVLVGATGAGGRSVFGLNVSNAGAFDADDVLWEVNSQTDTDMGYVLGKPVIVPTDNGRWVAIFGNGYNSVNGDPVLFIVDVATGAIIRKLAPVDGDDINPNGLGNVSALDTDGDGLADTVYGGDLLGNVWKFDISDATESNWTVALGGLPLFVAKDAAGVRQPITGAFDVSVGPGAGYMVYFGTGSYFKAGDNSAAAGQQTQTLYGIWDNGTALTTSRNTLVQQQITAASGTTPSTRSVTRNPVNYLSQRGWYLDLVVGAASATGEKFIATPRIQSGKILFPTYEPGVGSDCVPGGKNWLYALDPLSGGASFGQVTVPPGGTVGGGDTGAISTGDGAPSRGVGITQPQPLTPVYCDPSDPSCVPPTTPPATGCSEVIIDPSDPTKPLVVQRACGRQSWRQLL